MKCKARTASGKPCQGRAPNGGRGYCFAHNPAHARTRAEASKRGGRNSHTPHAGNAAAIPANIGSLEDAGGILNYVLQELLVMDNGIARARALLAAYEMYLKSFEIGELEARIAALEAGRT